MRKLSLPFVGFLQAAGVAAYVVLFFTLGTVLNPLLFTGRAPEIVLPIFMLLMFCFSALLCGCVTFGYPAFLAMNKQGKRAVLLVLFTLGWLALFVLCALATVVVMG